MELQERIKNYFEFKNGVTLSRAEIDKHLGEYSFGYICHLDLIDIDCWLHLQRLLNKEINYQDYLIIDKNLDNMVLEIDECDYEKINELEKILKGENDEKSN